jgi:hypothetical protein
MEALLLTFYRAKRALKNKILAERVVIHRLSPVTILQKSRAAKSAAMRVSTE